ncbi:phosphoribosylanthranilate isomerase [Pseudarthrobacter phenanthrenivorans]|jgi:phosphoribosylanthranilate isomerase|uniref:N-(5'-phosphoribosyl)anthranilate isomerase n=1 Tax=Pseudarthrobacter phenanthrenivorans TaxID=361575 RepID=A0A0B4E9I8_PSEPS|nr:MULTISPECIES: phosphoribosylanthranilate isomerase [Micrococcaceae]KIC63278.1 phosphoribosylanthranilate isomerase [Pseudarthrobacter phenanthrenivorans]MDJ0459206.1 phosphoribosylanthranilate isomerase [Arthrobacter sp. NQ7]
MFVKVCGLSTPESVREAVDAGADAVGFVLTASPRVVSPSQVASLLSGVPAGVSPIAVFRDEPVADALAIARAAGLQWIQLHGTRSRADVATVHDAGMKLVRAITMGAGPDEFEDWGEDLLLIDASVPGSGESWDYASVAALPALKGRDWLLAGGLDAANVAQASAAAHAWGVDVSSGVEASRGVKDPAKIRAFVHAAKAAATV